MARLDRFLSEAEVAALHEMAQDPGAWEVHDRHVGLNFYHQVWRIEEVLERRRPEIFDRLMNMAESIDLKLWRSIRDFACPEVEYIVYDVAVLARPGSIAKHTDNESCVSMVALLSDVSEFKGGTNCFRGRPNRKVALNKGDAVFFHGHGCEHWITPVTDGRRVILQFELRDSRLSEESGTSAHTAGGQRR